MGKLSGDRLRWKFLAIMALVTALPLVLYAYYPLQFFIGSLREIEDQSLVDEIGDLDDAIAAAAAAAGLPEDDYGIRYVEQPLDFREQLAMEMAGKARLLMRALGLSAMLPRTTSLDRLLDSLGRDLARLERIGTKAPAVED